MIIGLTGPTGSGKSTVSKAAEKQGFFVIDCDEVSHRVTAEKKALSALCKEFGNGILDENGTLDRKALAAVAFQDKYSTERLNKTVLPFITAEIERIIEKNPDKNILLDAPTLFESGMADKCDKVIAVIADKPVRLERIIRRDKISTFMALLRIGAGKPDSFYRERADIILENNGTEADLLTAAEPIFKEENQ